MVPVLPETAPFSPEQRAWLNGYLAGLFSRGPVDPVAGTVSAAPKPASALVPLTILFGSQTGTAEGLAKRAARDAGKRGYAATVIDMAQIDVAKLAQEKNVLVITSTYGDGEPPDNAKALHAALDAPSGPSLAAVRFSVCGLGDTNYVHFCKSGRDFDLFLERRGAVRVTPRADCDVDCEQKFTAWLDAALSAMAAASGQTASPVTPVTERETTRSVRAPRGYARDNPYVARVRSSRPLKPDTSAKAVYHIEFDLAASGLVYEPGDALGVYPRNCPALVADVVTALRCDGEEAVPAPDGTTTSLRHALTEHYELGRPSSELIERLAPALIARSGGATEPAMPHHVIDVLLARADVTLSPVEFVGRLRRMQPRLYSISSSPKAHGDQAHLTVGAVRYELGGRRRHGVCSTFLADRVAAGDSTARVFVQPNRAFRPPVDGDTPMIMVGPGTGIAPFRGFLHERRAAGARGRNWLFFGEQHAATDFIYRDEIAGLRQDGTLTRVDLAWSRDQSVKIYVQHRMLEHALELHAWLEDGAHFYVCGDANRMARDVDAALHRVVETAGGKTPAQAADYVEALKAAKRYGRDVY